jgi:hypothetical protein
MQPGRTLLIVNCILFVTGRGVIQNIGFHEELLIRIPGPVGAVG